MLPDHSQFLLLMHDFLSLVMHLDLPDLEDSLDVEDPHLPDFDFEDLLNLDQLEYLVLKEPDDLLILVL